MPLVRISLKDARSPDFAHQVGDCVHRAMMDAIARVGAMSSPAATADPPRPGSHELEAVGGAPASATRSKSIDGRTRQHEP